MRSGAEILTKCSLFILTILIITLGIAATTSQQPDTMGKNPTEIVQGSCLMSIVGSIVQLISHIKSRSKTDPLMCGVKSLIVTKSLQKITLSPIKTAGN